MPVIVRDVQLAYKILPLTLLPDGTCSIGVSKGYIDGTHFEQLSYQDVVLSTEDANAILDGYPNISLTRRQDIGKEVYSYLIANGIVEEGAIV